MRPSRASISPSAVATLASIASSLGSRSSITMSRSACNSVSTYVLLVASPEAVGVPTFVILFEPALILPVNATEPSRRIISAPWASLLSTIAASAAISVLVMVPDLSWVFPRILVKAIVCIP